MVGANDYWKMVRLALTILVLPVCCCSIGGGWLAGGLWFSEISARTSENDNDAREAEWRRLPESPEPVQRLVAAGPFVVYAETESGALLSCARPSRFDVNCWQTLPALPPGPQAPCIGGVEFPEPPADLEIVDTVEFDYCSYGLAGKAYVTSAKYILTATGEVWQWGIDRNDLAATPNLDRQWQKSREVGALLGLLLPLLMLGLTWYAPALRGLRRIVRKRQA